MLKRMGSVLLMLGVILITVEAGETKLSMELWSRITQNRADQEVTRNDISLERGYLGIAPTFNDKIKGNFTIDLFSSDKFADGAGLKLKYAWWKFIWYIPEGISNSKGYHPSVAKEE